ncbi:MAG: hypothetical protein ACI9LM_004273 [Alteromonadaceae bacterium]
MSKYNYNILPQHKLAHVIGEKLILCHNIPNTCLADVNPTAYYQLFNLWLKQPQYTICQSSSLAKTSVNSVVQRIPEKLIYREILHTSKQQVVSEILTLHTNEQLNLVFLQLLPSKIFSKENNNSLLAPPDVIKTVEVEAILFDIIDHLIKLAKAKNCQQITTKLYNPIFIKIFINLGFVITADDSPSDIIKSAFLTFSL